MYNVGPTLGVLIIWQGIQPDSLSGYRLHDGLNDDEKTVSDTPTFQKPDQTLIIMGFNQHFQLSNSVALFLKWDSDSRTPIWRRYPRIAEYISFVGIFTVQWCKFGLGANKILPCRVDGLQTDQRREQQLKDCVQRTKNWDSDRNLAGCPEVQPTVVSERYTCRTKFSSAQIIKIDKGQQWAFTIQLNTWGQEKQK